MRRFVCAVLSFVLCASLALPAFAAFTPSVQVKEIPAVEKIVDKSGKEVKDENGNKAIAVFVTPVKEGSEEMEEQHVFEGSLIITSVSDAKVGKLTDKKDEKLTKHEKEIQKDLKKIYDDMVKEKLEIPYDDFGLKAENMVVRDLLSLTWHPTESNSKDGESFEEIMTEGKSQLRITLNLGVGKTEKVYIMVYAHHDGDKKNEKSWIKMEVVNNGDGTVTAELGALGVIAVCVEK